MSDRLRIWIESHASLWIGSGFRIWAESHGSVWIGSSLSIWMKGGRLYVRMMYNWKIPGTYFNPGINNNWTKFVLRMHRLWRIGTSPGAQRQFVSYIGILVPSEGAAIAREEAVAMSAMEATVRADLIAMDLVISELCGRACFP